MASVGQCRTALEALSAVLDGMDPQVRARHIPARSVSCKIKDLGVVFAGRIGPDGVADLAQAPDDSAHDDADVRVTVTSDDLVAIAAGEQDLVHAWLKGKVHVAAGMRDVLRLRGLVGL